MHDHNKLDNLQGLTSCNAGTHIQQMLQSTMPCALINVTSNALNIEYYF